MNIEISILELNLHRECSWNRVSCNVKAKSYSCTSTMERKGLSYHNSAFSLPFPLILCSPAPFFFFFFRWIKIQMQATISQEKEENHPNPFWFWMWLICLPSQERLRMCCLGFWDGIRERTLRLGQSRYPNPQFCGGTQVCHACPIAGAALQVASLKILRSCYYLYVK